MGRRRQLRDPIDMEPRRPCGPPPPTVGVEAERRQRGRRRRRRRARRCGWVRRHECGGGPEEQHVVEEVHLAHAPRAPLLEAGKLSARDEPAARVLEDGAPPRRRWRRLTRSKASDSRLASLMLLTSERTTSLAASNAARALPTGVGVGAGDASVSALVEAGGGTASSKHLYARSRSIR